MLARAGNDTSSVNATGSRLRRFYALRPDREWRFYRVRRDIGGKADKLDGNTRHTRQPIAISHSSYITTMSTIFLCLLVIAVALYLLVAMLWPEKF